MQQDLFGNGKAILSEAESGVVFTKRHVVEFMLDLVGYEANADLREVRVLEPSCGEGAFLRVIVERLFSGEKIPVKTYAALKGLMRAFDIDARSVDTCRADVRALLISFGVPEGDADKLVKTWIRLGDFLLEEQEGSFDLVIGNPPYIRIEELDKDTQARYRAAYATLQDRADIYVAFIERSLSLLSGKGSLCFICTDRWTVNKYGMPLRKLITDTYRVSEFIDVKDASPFESEVTTYPVIFTIGQGRTEKVGVAKMRTLSQEECAQTKKALHLDVSRVDWFQGGDPWLVDGIAYLGLLRYLEGRFHPIQETAAVGIGIATGCDPIYIVDERTSLSLESSRAVPLVMRDDLGFGKIQGGAWRVINTFEADGSVIEPERYPLLKAYLAQHEGRIRNRHVAKKNPRHWYRTIDRLHADLSAKPKLLIPDIADCNSITFDPGGFYPHHNLYHVTSSHWDLEVLGGLLSSKIGLFFIWMYSMRMRGGYLRFQAQYLRKIRLPSPSEMEDGLASLIKAAFRERDFKRLDELVLKAYGLKEMPAFAFNDKRV